MNKMNFSFFVKTSLSAGMLIFSVSCYLKPGQVKVADEDLSPQQKTEVLFLRVQNEVINSQSCNNCHSSGGSSGIDLTSEAALLGYVDQQDPANSELLWRMRFSGDPRGDMPPRSRPALTQAQFDLLREYVFEVSGQSPTTTTTTTTTLPPVEIPSTTTTTTLPVIVDPPTSPTTTLPLPEPPIPSPTTTTTTTTSTTTTSTTLPGPSPVNPSPEVTFDLVNKVLVSANCVMCHFSGQNVDLSSREAILRGGAFGDPTIVVGDGVGSALYQSVVDKKPARMPTRRAVSAGNARYLTPEEVELIKTWIDQGAK